MAHVGQKLRTQAGGFEGHAVRVGHFFFGPLARAHVATNNQPAVASTVLVNYRPA
jgi:hypothetical protein